MNIKKSSSHRGSNRILIICGDYHKSTYMVRCQALSSYCFIHHQKLFQRKFKCLAPFTELCIIPLVFRQDGKML